MSTAILRLQDAKIYQKDHLVLSKVNFELKTGDFIYLIGKTGSGKSSLLKTLYGDLLLQDGVGEVVGYDLKHLKENDIPFLRRGIGVVFQDFQLLPDRSVKDNLLFVLKATGWSDKTKIESRIKEVLSQVSMEHKDYKMPHELSGGEQARVLLARALAQNTPLILADEPIAGLDPATQLTTMKMFGDLTKEGKGVLISLHDLNLAATFCTKIIMLDKGQLYAVGNPAKIMTDENLEKVFNIRAYHARTDKGIICQPIEVLSHSY